MLAGFGSNALANERVGYFLMHGPHSLVMRYTTWRPKENRDKFWEMREHKYMHDYEQKFAINELLIRYFRALDEKDFTLETMESIFTSDVSIERPNGSLLHGPADILSNQKESFTRFKATQHLLVGCDVRLHEATAHVRGNLIALHLWADGYGEPDKDENYFLAGGVITADATQTNSGWRISALKNDVAWRRGTGLKKLFSDPLYRQKAEND